MRTSSRPASCPLAGLILLGAVVVAAGAAAAVGEPTYSAYAGSFTYKSYCANCHGVGGRGDGYVAPTLRQIPTDLTRLAAENGGVYPEDRVRASIDGRTEVRAHGQREMPLWGDIFMWPEEDSPARREHVKKRIGELVEFVRGLQQPPAESAPPADE